MKIDLGLFICYGWVMRAFLAFFVAILSAGLACAKDVDFISASAERDPSDWNAVFSPTPSEKPEVPESILNFETVPGEEETTVRWRVSNVEDITVRELLAEYRKQVSPKKIFKTQPLQ